MTLRQTLNEHWPIDDVIVSCDECGSVIVHLSASDNRVWPSPIGYAVEIENQVYEHRQRYGHESVTVDITECSELKEIDLDITVDTKSND